MNGRSIKFRWAMVAGAASAVLQACQNSPPDQSSNASAVDSGGGRAANQSLRAAAEPFEALTEQAFAADWTTIDGLIGEARQAVAGAPSPTPVERSLAEIAASRSAQDRVGLALASVEGYRRLVEAQDRATADPPVAVSLLDYAGFRYDALAQAQSVDWGEMARTVQFARAQWDSVAGRVRSKAMPGVMSEALSAMAAAVERKDVTFARRAAATELALVDLLEEQTSRAP